MNPWYRKFMKCGPQLEFGKSLAALADNHPERQLCGALKTAWLELGVTVEFAEVVHDALLAALGNEGWKRAKAACAGKRGWEEEDLFLCRVAALCLCREWTPGAILTEAQVEHTIPVVLLTQREIKAELRRKRGQKKRALQPLSTAQQLWMLKHAEPANRLPC